MPWLACSCVRPDHESGAIIDEDDHGDPRRRYRSGGDGLHSGGYEGGGCRPRLYDEQLAGVTALKELSHPLPEATLVSIRQHRVVLKGPLATPSGTGFRSINVALRKEFDLYANVRPARTIVPGDCYEDIDLVLIRENTEGLYVGVEHYIDLEGDPKAAAESVMIITRFGVDRCGADLPLRLRLRTRPRTQEGDPVTQGEHPQSIRRGCSSRWVRRLRRIIQTASSRTGSSTPRP